MWDAHRGPMEGSTDTNVGLAFLPKAALAEGVWQAVHVVAGIF